jgi:hypothetical protein
MGFVVVFLLLIFWLVLAWRQFQQGDITLATLFLTVGVALTVYRLRALSRPRSGSEPSKPTP